MIPALIGALGGIIGGAMSSSMGYSNQSALAHQQYLYQRALANQQASLNENMWYKQFSAYNKYNDPSAVRARLSAAGLNPALAMSGGASAAPQSSGSFSSTGVSQGQAMVPGASFAPLGGLMDAVQSFAGAKKNLEEAKTQESVRALNSANAQLASAGIITEEQKAAALKIQNFVDDMTKFEKINRSVLENNLLKARADSVLKEIDVYNAQILHLNGATENERNIARSTVQMQTSQALLNVARIQFEGRMTRVQEKNCEALCNYYAAQASRIAVGEDRDRVALETEKELKKALDAVIREDKNLLYEATKAGFDLKRKDNEWKNSREFSEQYLQPFLRLFSVPIPLPK